MFSDEVPKEIQLERLTHCVECEFYNEGLCSKCGCFLLFKVKHSDSECPEKKWSKHYTKTLHDYV